MLSRAGDVHGHATRSARAGMYVSTRDHRSVGYRVPKEWATVPGGLREAPSLGAFKRGSKGGFLSQYAGFVCREPDCRVCAWQADQQRG